MQVLVLYSACSGSSYNSVYHLALSSVTSHKNLGLRPRFLWNIIYSPVGLVYNISVTDSGSMINPSLPHFKMILTPITFLLEYSLLSLLEKPHSSTGRALGSNLIQVCNKYAELHMLASSRTNKIAQLNKNGDACIFRRRRSNRDEFVASARCISEVRLRVRIFPIHLNLMI